MTTVFTFIFYNLCILQILTEPQLMPLEYQILNNSTLAAQLPGGRQFVLNADTILQSTHVAINGKLYTTALKFYIRPEDSPGLYLMKHSYGDLIIIESHILAPT